MEEINSAIDQISKFGSGLYGLSGFVLTVIFCLLLGFVLKFLKRFPNEAIPVAVILCGMILCVMLADPITDSLPFRLWLGKNAVIGGIGGGLAWLLHHNRRRIPLLKNLVAKFAPDSGNSEHAAFTKTPTDKDNPSG